MCIRDRDRCRCGKGGCETPIAHFEIPQLLNDYGELAVDYIGSTDMYGHVQTAEVGFTVKKQ